MSRKAYFLFLGVLTVVNMAALGTLAYHRWSGPKLPENRERCDLRFENLIDELSLGPRQVEGLDISRKALHKDLNELTRELVTARNRMADFLAEDPPNEEGLQKSLNEIGRLQAAAQRRVISHLLTVKSHLDPIQRKKFFELIRTRFSSQSIQPLGNRPLP